MRQEVIDFYNEHKIPVEKMVIAGGRRGLQPYSVKEAAETVYDEIQAGLDVKPIRIAWLVYEKAKRIPVRPKPEAATRKSEVNEKLDLLIAMMKEHMTPWYKKLWRWINAVS